MVPRVRLFSGEEYCQLTHYALSLTPSAGSSRAPVGQKAFLQGMKQWISDPATALYDFAKNRDLIFSKEAEVSIGDDPDQIEAAVDALCDDDRATLQTNVSRIKRKLVDKVGRLAADQYAIVRGRDGVYRIAVIKEWRKRMESPAFICPEC